MDLYLCGDMKACPTGVLKYNVPAGTGSGPEEMRWGQKVTIY